MKLFNKLAVLAIATAMASPAFAQETVTLKVSADTPSVGSAWAEIVDPWLVRMEEASGGKLKFDRYPDGTLTKMANTVNQVIAGVSDIGWDLPAPYGKRFASLNVTTLPGIFNDPELAAAAIYRAYEQGVIGTEFGDDFKLLWVQVTQNVSFFSKGELNPVDFATKKIGVGNKSRAALVEGVGGVPVVVGPPGYYNSMQRGVVNSLMTSVSALTAYRVDELVDNILTGPFGGGMLIVGMNQKVYDGLPDDIKKIIDQESGVKQSRIASKSQWDFDGGNVEKIINAGGTQNALGADDMATWQPLFDKVIANWLEATENGDVILQKFKDEMAKGL